MNGRVMNEAGPQNLLVETQSCEMNTPRRKLIDEGEKGEKRRDAPLLLPFLLTTDRSDSFSFSLFSREPQHAMHFSYVLIFFLASDDQEDTPFGALRSSTSSASLAAAVEVGRSIYNRFKLESVKKHVVA